MHDRIPHNELLDALSFLINIFHGLFVRLFLRCVVILPQLD
jgi:hypothetical protein